jgi:hypothetical protein
MPTSIIVMHVGMNRDRRYGKDCFFHILSSTDMLSFGRSSSRVDHYKVERIWKAREDTEAG